MSTKRVGTRDISGAKRLPDDAVLPFPVRQRLWDQLWQRLLAPPVEEGDRTPPTPPRTNDGEVS